MPKVKDFENKIGNYQKLMKDVAFGKIVANLPKKLRSMDCSQVLNKSIADRSKCIT